MLKEAVGFAAVEDVPDRPLNGFLRRQRAGPPTGEESAWSATCSTSVEPEFTSQLPNLDLPPGNVDDQSARAGSAPGSSHAEIFRATGKETTCAWCTGAARRSRCATRSERSGMAINSVVSNREGMTVSIGGHPSSSPMPVRPGRRDRDR